MARRQQFLVALAVELDRALLHRFRSPTQSLNVVEFGAWEEYFAIRVGRWFFAEVRAPPVQRLGGAREPAPPPRSIRLGAGSRFQSSDSIPFSWNLYA
jgi:hypothetical protein